MLVEKIGELLGSGLQQAKQTRKAFEKGFIRGKEGELTKEDPTEELSSVEQELFDNNTKLLTKVRESDIKIEALKIHIENVEKNRIIGVVVALFVGGGLGYMAPKIEFNKPSHEIKTQENTPPNLNNNHLGQ